MKDGKSRAASSIASHASLSGDNRGWESELGEVDVLPRQNVIGTMVGEEARRKAHEDGVPAKWCEEKVKEFHSECVARGKCLGRTKWKVAELEVAESVVARSVAEEQEEVAEPKVQLPEVEKVGEKRSRVGENTVEEEEVQEVRELRAPLGPRAICGGLFKRVGKESVFAGADQGLYASGGSTHAAVGVS